MQPIEEVFSAYYQDVYRYLYSLSHDASLSEDLASDVFLDVLKSIGGFRGESDLKTWLFSIARHKWYDDLRRQKRQIKPEVLSEFYESREKSPVDQCSEKALLQRIYTLLGEQPPRAREIVLMRLEGYSFYEIGKKHGVSESSARVIDFRTKAKIREILKKEGLDRD